MFNSSPILFQFYISFFQEYSSRQKNKMEFLCIYLLDKFLFQSKK